jgi:hypothetical protein
MGMYSVTEFSANMSESIFLPPGDCARLIVVIEAIDALSGSDEFHVFIESRTKNGTPAGYERPISEVLDRTITAADESLVMEAADVDLAYPQHNLNVSFIPDPGRTTPMQWIVYAWAVYR